MRKDRDSMYPTYPYPYMGYQPMNNMPNFPNQGMMNPNDIINQINALEKRVSNLETIINTGKYNTSGYQMM